MILIEPSRTEAALFLDAVTLAGQMRAAGFNVCIREGRLPDDLGNRQKYEAAAFVRDEVPSPVAAIVAIGCEAVDDTGLQDLRRVSIRQDCQVILFGRFADRQSVLSAQAKYAYVSGGEPHCIDLALRPDLAVEGADCPCFGVDVAQKKPHFLPDLPGLLIWAGECPAADRRAWASLAHSRSIAPIILATPHGKAEWFKASGPGGQIYSPAELTPAEFAEMARLLVIAAPIGDAARVQCLVANMQASGGLVIDATEAGDLAHAGGAILRGPADPRFLHDFLRETVLPNRAGLQPGPDELRQIENRDLAGFLGGFGLVPGAAPVRRGKPDEASRVLFMPTNGVGLGHARRCTLVAREFPANGPQVRFAAFPSCGPLVAEAGFDWSPLVPKSTLHDEGGANDVLNFGRIRRLAGEASVFVFDGGFVFDSVMRSVVGSNRPAVWLRRGLWSAQQDNTIALDRGKVFSRVLVPGEAFDELNRPLTRGQGVFDIGPVVEQVQVEGQQVRAMLRERFQTEFARLVVSMPGSGVAMDNAAQIQTVCAAIEPHSDVLHLVLAWPSSVVPPVWHGWKQSRVVTTFHGSMLAAASDFVVTAAGYNSFHEAMYNRVPAIFVPQVAPFIDDQTARAEAAVVREVAVHVEAGRLDMLGRQVDRFLSGDKVAQLRANFDGITLPATGNAEAAARILELIA